MTWSVAHFVGVARKAQALSEHPELFAPLPAQSARSGPDMPRMSWFGFSPEDGQAVASGDYPMLELKGVSASPDPALAGAFIAVQGGMESYYRLGDLLPGNAGTLAEVTPDHVTIRRGDSVAVLPFSESQGAPPAPHANAPESAYDEPGDLVARFQANPQPLLEEAGLEPVEPGRDMGYLYRGKDSRLAAIGLIPGDVVVAINGTPVGDVDSDRLRVYEFSTAQMLRLKIQRGASVIDLDYRIP